MAAASGRHPIFTMMKEYPMTKRTGIMTGLLLSTAMMKMLIFLLPAVISVAKSSSVAGSFPIPFEQLQKSWRFWAKPK